MKTKKNNRLDEIASIIQNAERVLILPHILPDGDTVGSSIALYMALKIMGKQAHILLDEEIPYNIKFLSHENICNTIDTDLNPDLAVSIDCSDIGRLGVRGKYIDESKISLNVDHHITNTYFAKYNFVMPQAAATGEIVYLIIKTLGVSITKDIATCLYTALSTDTGSFKYDNTSPQTHRIAAELLESNIDLNFITTELYQNKPMYKVKLLADVLNTLEFYFEGKLAILYITKEMIEKNDAKIEDTDGLIEYARDIYGVEVGVVLKEMKRNEIKVGFRAKYNVDVSKVAKEFDGGGHTKASGCTICDSIENAKKMIITTVENYL